MNDLGSWLYGGVRFTAVAAVSALLLGCPGQVSGSGAAGATTSGNGGDGGSGGAGGSACQPEEEICDGADNDCDGEIDDVTEPPEGCACEDGATQECYSGAPGTDGVGLCAKGTQTCAGGTWGACEGQVTPTDEVCNLQDDDCDGTVDDMEQLTCGIGECAATVEACVNGVQQTCVPGQPAVEVCDGKDNNCNQLVDESDPELGLSCMTGQPGACAAGKYECNGATLQCVGLAAGLEACDGIDNDCDGVVDNNIPGTGGACGTGAPGVCSVGTISCAFSQGSYQVDCFATVMPSVEICDGLDNDCDGQNDDGDPQGGFDCMTGQPGICGPGILHCVNGSVQCVANQTLQPETCNGLDDDCDGMIDEGDPGGGVNCPTGLLGICSTGVTSCTNGTVVCNQTTFPAVEVCNGTDEDCDGVADNGNPGGGAACTTGLPGVCAPGTITCEQAQLSCKQNVLPTAEVCGNAIDENCDGVAVAAPTVYFNETFANNNAGWTLGQNWSIGPTAFSAANTSCGIGDPAQDHTPTADNGVAGNVLGGNISTALGGPYYLTSPVINTAAAPTLFLEYWRWLHSDYPNFMVDTVEVYNGSTWVNVWQNPSGVVVNDTAWTKMSHDVTAHKNANFRVRFSYLIGGTGVFTCAGWNIDDIQLVNAQCN